MTTTSCWIRIDSPLGELVLTSDGEGLTGLSMGDWGGGPARAGVPDADDVLEAASAQLAEYFAGRREAFTVPLRARASAFQRLVWEELVRVPFGRTVSYGELARRIGRPSAVRAVARANATNPIGIVVPCHRVIGADGRLSGYAGGVERKAWLLAHEGAAVPRLG